MPRASHLLSSALLLAAARAHFTLEYPESIGFDDESQDNGPCGGVDPDFSSQTVTDFHVGGDAIAMQNGHSQVNWLFRATLDQTASSNWTQLFPIVQVVGLNMFCEPSVAVPEEFVGKKGLIGVVANAPDGLLYQCAAVNFVKGVGESQDACTNNTDIQAAFTDDEELSALVGDETSSSEDDSDATQTADEAEPTNTEDGDSSARALGPAIGQVVSVLLMGAAFLV